MPSPASPENLVRLSVIGVILLGMAAAAVAHFAASPVHANGRVMEFDRRVAGPYEIALSTSPPRVGNLYLSILLTEAASTAPVLDATVVVAAVGPPVEGETGPQTDLQEVGPIVVNPDPDPIRYPGYYDTTEATEPIVLDRVGTWIFTVSVDGAVGAATAEFPVEVTSLNPITGIITLVTLLAFIIVVALAIRMYIRERRRSRST